MNDSSEIKHAIDISRIVLQDYKSTRKEKVEFLEALEMMLNPISKFLTEFHIYVCSFSEDGDLLSQWRAYCGNGSGYSIGFTYPKLESQMKSQHFKLGRCIYEESTQKKIVSEIVDQMLNAFDLHTMQLIFSATEKKDASRNLNLHEADSQAIFFDKFFIPLMTISPLFKHSSFSEEKEWRMISYLIPPNANQINYRQGKWTIIPHFEFQLGNEALDVEEIIIGPNPYSELAQASLKGHLIKNNINFNKIRHSRIPYRSW